MSRDAIASGFFAPMVCPQWQAGREEPQGSPVLPRYANFRFGLPPSIGVEGSGIQTANGKHIMTGTALGASAPTIFQFRSTEVRTLVLDGEVWFVASDVAKALGYTHAPHMLRVLDEDEKGVQIVDTLGGPQELGIISESGLYHAVLKSRKPEAKPFRKWVTAEVLPAIRKTGQYVAQPRADTPADLREVWPVTMATPPGFGYMVATRSQKAKRQPRRIGVSA
jgi:hypothetical protein